MFYVYQHTDLNKNEVVFVGLSSDVRDNGNIIRHYACTDEKQADWIELAIHDFGSKFAKVVKAFKNVSDATFFHKLMVQKHAPKFNKKGSK